MNKVWTPFRWPRAWGQPSAFELLRGTPIDCVVVERLGDDPISRRAQALGLGLATPSSLPQGVAIQSGVWPGVKLSVTGQIDRADAGPTGAPWVDSNGWRVELQTALRPGTQVWIDAKPAESRLSPESYLTALCDAASFGGRWLISLDDNLAAGILAQNTDALATWRKLTTAAGFFAARQEWSQFKPRAVVGIVSDFKNGDGSFDQELLNLVARTNQLFHAVPSATLFSHQALDGLKGVIYAAGEAPGAVVHRKLLEFAQDGGTLITGRQWGAIPGAPIVDEPISRFALHSFGQGKIAVAKDAFDDPYRIAQDSCVLVGHRNDLLRFWNAGSFNCRLSASSDEKRALLQMVLYANMRSNGNPTISVAGRYRTAKVHTLDQPDGRSVEIVQQPAFAELHLPRLAQYAAVELET